MSLTDIVNAASAYTLNPARKEEVADMATDFTADLPKFDLQSVAPCVQQAHTLTKQWVRDIHTGSAPYWLTLFGVPGCGKTMLATLARHTLREKGKKAQLWNWPRVMRRCLNGEWDLLDHICELPVLILDDVGAEFTSSAKASDLNTARLYEIAESRLGKWTLITSNLNVEQMALTIGTRFVSRLFRGNSKIVDLTTAQDYCFTRYQQQLNKH